MLIFDSLPKEGNIMDKITLPSSKSGSLIIENFPISQKPNLPTRCDHHLHEVGFPKLDLALNHHLHELALEDSSEQADLNCIQKTDAPYLHELSSGKAHNGILGNLPMTSLQHILSIQTIFQEQPSKELRRHPTARLP
jgi:hypothetical protein